MGRLINIVSCSDIHQGAPKIPATVIPTNLRKVLFPLLTKDTDLLVIAGDLTDGLLEPGGDASVHMLELINDLIDLAVQHKFYIRILQGTFTHDRLQNNLALFRSKALAPLHGQPIVKFISKVDIEHIESLGITLLYKPDNLPYKNAWEVIEKLIGDVGYPIDFMVNHGYFSHLLPNGIHEITNTLDAAKVSKKIRGCVFNGHVHTPMVYDKIINHGSFDRLCHGEEEDKGVFTVQYDTETYALKYDFVKNPYATIFKTIDLLDIEEDIELCTQRSLTIVDKLAKNVIATCPVWFIRFVSNASTTSAAVSAALTAKYTNLVITELSPKNKKKKKASEDELLQASNLDDLPSITPQNVVEMAHLFAEERGFKHLSLPYLTKKLAL